jgi:hypothetical protein
MKKQNGGAGYVAGTCFMAIDVCEKYQSQTHQLLEHFGVGKVTVM